MADSRTNQRQRFSDADRIVLLEQDADRHELVWSELETRLDRIQQVLIGILISVTTASVLMAINLTVK